MKQENLDRLIEMCGRAYALAVASQMGDKIEAGLNDEVAGEMAEFLAHLDGDTGSMPDEDAIDAQLRDIAQELTNGTKKPQKQAALDALNHATTLIYNIEGNEWQMAYEVLEAVIANLQYAPPNKWETA